MRKNRITIKELGRMQAKSLVNERLPETIKHFSRSFKRTTPDFEINEAFQNEIIAFEVAAVIHGMGVAFSGKGIFKQLTQAFLEALYEEIFENPDAEDQFREAIAQRCLAYGEQISLGQEKAPLGIGKQFLEFYLKETDGKHIFFMMEIGAVFFTVALHLAKFFKEVNESGEIVE